MSEPYNNGEDFNFEDLPFANIRQPQLPNNDIYDDSETQDVGGQCNDVYDDPGGLFDAPPEGNVTGEKQGRGLNLIHWGEDGRERVKWSNTGAPVWLKKKCSNFSNFLGSLAADGGLYPINVTDWRLLKIDRHKNAWDRVKGTIDWEDPATASRKSVIKTYVFKRFQDRWKHHKSMLKRKYWEPKKGTPERFCCDAELTKAAINVSNRSHRKIYHSTRTRTFQAIVYEWQVENGVEDVHDMWEIFKLTHTKKGSKDQYIDAASTKMDYERIEEEKKKLNIEITPQVREDIYVEVLGVEKRNLVRRLGAGVKWQDVPYIHTEKKAVPKFTKVMEILQATVEEQRLEVAKQRSEAEREKVEATKRENNIRLEFAEREKRMADENDKFKREQVAPMDKMTKVVEEITFLKMGQWLKEAGFSAIDTSSEGIIGHFSQQQVMIPVIPTPSKEA